MDSSSVSTGIQSTPPPESQLFFHFFVHLFRFIFRTKSKSSPGLEEDKERLQDKKHEGGRVNIGNNIGDVITQNINLTQVTLYFVIQLYLQSFISI